MANKDDDFSGIDSLTKDDVLMSAVDLLAAGNEIMSFIREANRDFVCETIIQNPILSVGLVLNARVEKLHFDYMESQHKLCSLLSDLVESIDCAGARKIEYWMLSDLAAIDKAKELGIDILPEYSIADLRYKIDLALREAI